MEASLSLSSRYIPYMSKGVVPTFQSGRIENDMRDTRNDGKRKTSNH